MVLMMLQKLRMNKQFQPCPVDSEDELFPNGIFIFNISSMTEFMNANQPLFPKELILIKELDNWNKGTFHEETVNSADLSRPIILAEISPKRFSLIRGHYRIEKANRLGVRYWNEKIKNLQEWVSQNAI